MFLIYFIAKILTDSATTTITTKKGTFLLNFKFPFE